MLGFLYHINAIIIFIKCFKYTRYIGHHIYILIRLYAEDMKKRGISKHF